MATIIGVLLLCMIGAMLQGITGIGFSMVFMTFCPLLISYTAAANVNRLIGAALAICGLWQWKAGVKWKLLLPPLMASLMMSMLGVEIFVRVDEEILRRLLGVLLLGLTAATWRLQKKNIKIRPSIFLGVVFGAFAGFVSGLFGILGPILAIYYVNATGDTKEYKGTLNMHFTVLSLWNNLFYSLQYGYWADEAEIGLIGTLGALIMMVWVFRWNVSRQREKVMKFMLLATGGMALTMLL